MSLKLKLLYVCCFALLAANVALIVVNWNYTKWAHTHDETPDVCLESAISLKSGESCAQMLNTD